MKKVILGLTMIAVAIFMLTNGYTHEGGPNAVQHMQYPGDWQVGAKQCPAYTVWCIDEDKDGKVDACRATFLYHGKIHQFPTKLTVRDGKSWCSCEPLVSEIGGTS